MSGARVCSCCILWKVTIHLRTCGKKHVSSHVQLRFHGCARFTTRLKCAVLSHSNHIPAEVHNLPPIVLALGKFVGRRRKPQAQVHSHLHKHDLHGRSRTRGPFRYQLSHRDIPTESVLPKSDACRALRHAGYHPRSLETSYMKTQRDSVDLKRKAESTASPSCRIWTFYFDAPLTSSLFPQIRFRQLRYPKPARREDCWLDANT